MVTTTINGVEYRSSDKYANIWIAADGTAIGPSGKVLVSQRIREYYAYGVKRADGKYRMIRTHLLVAEAFLEPRPEGLFVDHINRNQHDNHYSNLRYVTNAVNVANNKRVAQGHPVGVYPVGNRYRVQVQVGHAKCTYVGLYRTQEEAVAARTAYLLALKDKSQS